MAAFVVGSYIFKDAQEDIYNELLEIVLIYVNIIFYSFQKAVDQGLASINDPGY